MITNSKELDKTSIRISALRRDKEKILSSSPSLMGLQEASRRRLRQVMTAISLIKGMGGRERRAGALRGISHGHERTQRTSHERTCSSPPGPWLPGPRCDQPDPRRRT